MIALMSVPNNACALTSCFCFFPAASADTSLPGPSFCQPFRLRRWAARSAGWRGAVVRHLKSVAIFSTPAEPLELYVPSSPQSGTRGLGGRRVILDRVCSTVVLGRKPISPRWVDTQWSSRSRSIRQAVPSSSCHPIRKISRRQFQMAR